MIVATVVPTDLIEEELLREAGGEEAGGGCEVGEGLHAGAVVSSDWGDCSQVTLLSALRSGIFIPGSASLSAPRVRTLRTLRSLKSPIRIAAEWSEPSVQVRVSRARGGKKMSRYRNSTLLTTKVQENML